MKSTMKLIFITICLGMCSCGVTAQESIKFTWTVVGYQEFYFLAPECGKYAID